MKIGRRQADTPNQLDSLLASDAAALSEDDGCPRPDHARGRLEGVGVSIHSMAASSDRARETRLRKQQETDARLKRLRGFRRALSAEVTPVTFQGVPVEDLPRPPQPA